MNRLARLEVYLRCLDKGPQMGFLKVWIQCTYQGPGSSGEYVGDVFAKSEKWLGTPPTPDCAKWTSREAEILGWQAYIYDLTAWAMQASLEFGSEIEHACRWPDPLHWNQLAVPATCKKQKVACYFEKCVWKSPENFDVDQCIQ